MNKKRGQTQRQLITAGALASALLGFALLTGLLPPVQSGPVTVSLIDKQRELFGGSLVFNVTATSAFTMPATTKAFYGSIKHFRDKAGTSLDRTSNFTGVLNKWEFLTLVNVTKAVDNATFDNYSYECFNNQTGQTGNCTGQKWIAHPYNQTTATPTWVSLSVLSGASVKKGDSLIIRQHIEGGVGVFETVDVVPFIIDREYPEFSFLWATATREVNKTVSNPTGHTVYNATFEVRFNQTELTGSDCAQNNVSIAVSNGTSQYALNSTGRGAYPLAFNNSDGEFIYKIRMGELGFPAGASVVVSAYCGAGATTSASNTYYEFGSTVSQDGWIYFSNGSTIRDYGPDADHPDTIAGTFTYTATDFWKNTTSGAFNHTSSGTDYVANTVRLNATDNLYICRIKMTAALATTSNDYVFHDQGGGYGSWGVVVTTNWGGKFYNGYYSAGPIDTDIIPGVWYSLANLLTNGGGNNTAITNGAVNSSDATGTPSIVGNYDVYLGLSTATYFARATYTECGFIKGQPWWVTEDWVRLFQNTTLARGNYTITTSSTPSTTVLYSSLSTSPSNRSYSTTEQIFNFNVSWSGANDTKIINLDGTNHTVSGGNYSTTGLTAGYHTWYAFANETGGAKNQTPEQSFYFAGYIRSPVKMATYLGSTNYDGSVYAFTEIDNIKLDSSGNYWLTGNAGDADFPVTPGVNQTAYAGNQDSFVVKLNSTMGVVKSTFLGGTAYEYGQAIAFNPSQTVVYAMGTTFSTDFPTTPLSSGVNSSTPNGNCTTYISSYYMSNLTMIRSGVIRGTTSNCDGGETMDVDNATGDIYVLFWQTTNADLPVTPGANKTTAYTGNYTYVARLNSSLQILAGSYLPGNGYALRALPYGVYVLGWADQNNVPVTPGANSTTLKGSNDYYVVQMNQSLAVFGGTYLGGTGNEDSTYGMGGLSSEVAAGIAIGTDGKAYVAGSTRSLDFPITPGANQTTFNGNNETYADAFLVELNSTLGITRSTYLGGPWDDMAASVALDSQGRPIVSGRTQGTNSTYPFALTPLHANRTDNPNQNIYAAADREQGYLMKFNSTFGVIGSTFVGGTTGSDGFTSARTVISDANDYVYIEGVSYDSYLPVTPGVNQTSIRSSQQDDYFVLNLTFDVDAPAYSAIGSTPTNGSQFQSNVSLLVNWWDPALDTVIVNVNGTNYTVTGGNFSSLQLRAGSYDWYAFANDSYGNVNQTPTYRFEMVPRSWGIDAYLNGMAANATLAQTTTTALNISNSTGFITNVSVAATVFLNGTNVTSTSAAYTNSTTWSALATGRTLSYCANVTDTMNYSGTTTCRSFTVHNVTGYLRFGPPSTTLLNVTNCTLLTTVTPQNQTSPYGSFNFTSNASAPIASYWKVNATSSRYSICVSANASGTGCTYLDTTPRRVYTGQAAGAMQQFWVFFNCTSATSFNSAKDFKIQMNTSLG